MSKLEFICCVATGDVNKLKQIVENNIRPTQFQCCYNEALMIACTKGYLEMVQYLVSLGANVHTCHNYSIVIATEKGYLDLVKYLISVNENIRDYVCENDIAMIASQNGHLNIIKYLVSIGSDISVHINNLVRVASQNGYSDVVKYLVSMGADVNVIVVGDKIVRELFDSGYFGLLYKILKNNQKFKEIEKIVVRINENLLVNNIGKNNSFLDIKFV